MFSHWHFVIQVALYSSSILYQNLRFKIMETLSTPFSSGYFFESIEHSTVVFVSNVDEFYYIQ